MLAAALQPYLELPDSNTGSDATAGLAVGAAVKGLGGLFGN